MTDENTENAAIDAIDMYKSLSIEHRAVDSAILGEFLVRNIAVDSIRYGEFRGMQRGAVKALDGSRYYFHMTPSAVAHIVPADTVEKSAEVERILRSCKLGCDITKAVSDAEEEEKAMDAGVGSLPPASMKESVAVAQNQAQVTDVHPGATVASTPQADGSAQRWHGTATKSDADEAIDLLKSTSVHLERTLQQRPQHLEPLEVRYMREVFGKSVTAGPIPPAHRKQFAEWAAARVRTNISALKKWTARG